jgi:hypothetical protein
MVKYLNEIIPVGKLVNRYDKKYPAQCPSCEEPIETQEHLHQCLHPTRQQWRVQFTTAMQEVMDKYLVQYRQLNDNIVVRRHQ